jgi:hypothetical protein
MLTDDQLGDRLHARLADEVAHIHADPGLLHSLHRRHARRAAAGGIALAVPALAAAVALAVVATGSAVGHPPAATGSAAARSQQPPVRDVAYVTARTRTALANASNYILRSELTPAAGYRDVSLVDMKTGRTRFDSYGPHGPANSITETGPVETNPTVLVVDYPNKAWWTYRMTPPPNVPQSARRLQIAPLQSPTEIADAIAQGTAQIVGEQTLNGHHALHLRVTGVAELRTTIDVWVDAQTYLLYRLSATKSGRTSTSDFEWLTRTAANVAALDLVPPAGFTHHDKPIEPAAVPGHG